jgi:flagellar biosynthesis protein FlhF
MMISRLFSGKNSRQVMNKIQEELGPDAEIVSSRRTLQGIEMEAQAEQHEASIPTPADMQGEAETINPIEALRDKFIAAQAATTIPAPSTIATAAARPDNNANVLAGELAGLKSDMRAMKLLLERGLLNLGGQSNESATPLNARQQLFQEIFQKLGLDAKIAKRLLANVDGSVSLEQDWENMQNILRSNISLENKPIHERTGIMVIIGNTGDGKTTNTAKLAAQYVMQGEAADIGIISIDNSRATAKSQLVLYGNILGVEFHAAKDKQDLLLALRAMATKRLILVDTPGVHPQNKAEMQEFLAILRQQQNAQFYCMLDATTQTAVLENTLKTFKASELAGCIISKVDGCESLSPVLGVTMQHQIPISYISNGASIPHDLHMPDIDQLMNQAFTKVSTAQVESVMI